MRLSRSLWVAWQMEHPILAQTTSDIQQARALYTGRPADIMAGGIQPLTQREFQTICINAGLDASVLPSDVFDSMTSLLIDEANTEAESVGNS